jgi:hypothetical protein
MLEDGDQANSLEGLDIVTERLTRTNITNLTKKHPDATLGAVIPARWLAPNRRSHLLMAPDRSNIF